ncbi:MAG: biotin--[acetyl-CoA-carboxylase] ligase [Pseudomonadota bacterium]
MTVSPLFPAPPPWPSDVDRVTLPSVDSTMAEVRRRAPVAGVDTWVHALDQSAGTGRRGRAWAQPPGNFSASLLLRPEEPPSRLALRSFVASLALRDALVAVTGEEDWFQMKWPNDVLMHGGKVAGILLETLAEPSGPALIVGIGVNLAAAPPVAELEPGAIRPRSLAGSGIKVAPGDFLDYLAPAFYRWDRLLRDQGFDPLRRAWLDRAARIGQPVVARLPNEEIAGIFRTVDATGALVLDTDAGPRTIAAGDVFF